jgi:uncharacterized protein (DUF1330 family)
VDVREGDWPGDVVLVEFPSMKHARDFYDSAAYQESSRSVPPISRAT